MISATSLIAVLMQVISIIFANPNIPQETKDLVFQQITQAIQAENGTTSGTTGTTGGTQTTQPTLGGADTTPTVTPTVPVEVSQACKDETVNLKEKEYNVNAIIKNRDEQIRKVDIFEGNLGPEARERRKQEIRDTMTPMILKAQEIVVTYQGKVSGVCN